MRHTDGNASGRSPSFGEVTKVTGENRNLLVLVLFACLTYPAAAKAPVVMASFETPASVVGWRSVNDGVMGGISKGGVELTDQNTLLFSGELSLENNGGFASIRNPVRDMDLSGTKGVVVKAGGDGRTYWVDLRTDRNIRASSYRAFLKTEKGTFTETFIPFTDFKLQAFGRELPGGDIDPAKITSFGFTLADKKAGPFKMELEYAKAVFQEPNATTSEPVVGKATIAAIATKAGSFKTLLAAAEAAGLTGALAGDQPLTVFAPTDDAFAKLPAGTVEGLLKPENKQKLVDILKYHVVAGSTSLGKAIDAGELTTLQGDDVKVGFEDGRVLVGSAALNATPIAASNGLVYVIDQVLLPPKKPVAKPLSAKALVGLAIDRGVPLFNNGSPEACAAVYEVTVQALRTSAELSEASREDLANALVKTKSSGSAREKAWILRHALDRVLTQQAKGI